MLQGWFWLVNGRKLRTCFVGQQKGPSQRNTKVAKRHKGPTVWRWGGAGSFSSYRWALWGGGMVCICLQVKQMKNGRSGHLESPLPYFLTLNPKNLKTIRWDQAYAVPSRPEGSSFAFLPLSQGGPLFIEGFCWSSIIFLKEVLKAMSFIFFLNNGFATMAAVEQFPGYYQNLTSYYSGPEEPYMSSYPQADFYGGCDAAGQLPTEVPPSEPSPTTFTPTVISGKSKRRMEKTVQKEILSAKKNSESNIINQFYSFFSSREKSERVVERCALLLGKTQAQIEPILTTFYSAIRFINAKRGRKYVNVSIFLKFFTEEELGEYLSEMRERLASLQHLTLGELCEIFRRCAKYYLREVSTSAILTSKRISVVSKEEHLKKRRKVLRSVMGN